MRVCVCMFVQVYAYMSSGVQRWKRLVETLTHLYTRGVHAYACVHACMCACLRVRVYRFMCTCMFACMLAHVRGRMDVRKRPCKARVRKTMADSRTCTSSTSGSLCASASRRRPAAHSERQSARLAPAVLHTCAGCRCVHATHGAAAGPLGGHAPMRPPAPLMASFVGMSGLLPHTCVSARKRPRAAVGLSPAPPACSPALSAGTARWRCLTRCGVQSPGTAPARGRQRAECGRVHTARSRMPVPAPSHARACLCLRLAHVPLPLLFYNPAAPDVFFLFFVSPKVD